MKQYIIILCVTVFIGCKDSSVPRTSPSGSVLPITKDSVMVAPIVPQPIDNNLFVRMKAQPELALWVTQLASTSISEILQMKNGPFTILAPSEEAFIKSDSLIKLKDIASIEKMVKSHIISKEMSSSYLVKGMKYGGSYSVTSLAGTKLTFTKRDYEIIVSDECGNEGLIGKSDILGTNGVIHVLNGMLGLD